jgi:NitT/TauT family transport system permease protein
MTWSRRIAAILPAVLFGLLFLALWQWFVIARDIKPYLLPKPSDIWHQISVNQSEIVKATRNTGANALVGLICGSAAGVAMAFLASRFRAFSEMVTPLSAAINAMPIIVLAPMFHNIFSTTSSIPRRLVVTIVVFFPIFINTFKGLTQIDPVHDELMRSYAASDWAVLGKVRVPGAIPFFFTGLKLAASLCVIAAVVAEYFGGLQNGLGSRITSAAANSAYGRAWAYVAAACALGLLFYVATLVLQRVAMPWRRHGAAT